MESPFDRTLFIQALTNGNIIWRKHALEKMLERRISREEVLAVLEVGVII
ncbi:MAG: DUF4258 domain-containing protein [Saprospirales bacterium]|nr:DUF4258 domain-containing protein [Saprospirales bacterium]MBK8921435.1 DUF4258 domain-containing protein [Saprospirales bacterium]